MLLQEISINMIDDHLILNRYCFHHNVYAFEGTVSFHIAGYFSTLSGQ